MDYPYDPFGVESDGDERQFPYSSSASGTITTTLTWTPSNSRDTSLPPTKVCVMETSEVYAQADPGTGMPSVGAQDGLGNVQTPVDGNGQTTSSGSRLDSIDNSARNTVLTLTPCAISASASTTEVSEYDPSSVSIYINYSAAISNISIAITLGGTTPDANGDGGLNILVGQGCTASLSTPTGYSASNYKWSVSGSTFLNWVFQDPNNSQASLYDAGPGTQTNPTYKWYWNDVGAGPTQEKVTCNATVKPPSGQGSAFSLTVTQTTAVYGPTLSSYSNTVGKGYVQNYQSNGQNFAQLVATNSTQGFGSAWQAKVAMPSAVNFGTGQWTYAQLITPKEYVTLNNGIVFTSQNTVKGIGLDEQFPYMGSSFAADVRTNFQGDSPKITGLTNDYKAADLDSVFMTFLMFLPPGPDSKWVALAESYWLLNGLDAQQPNPGGWTTYPATQSAGNVSLVYDFVPKNLFPTWTQIVPNGPFIVN